MRPPAQTHNPKLCEVSEHFPNSDPPQSASETQIESLLESDDTFTSQFFPAHPLKHKQVPSLQEQRPRPLQLTTSSHRWSQADEYNPSRHVPFIFQILVKAAEVVEKRLCVECDAGSYRAALDGLTLESAVVTSRNICDSVEITLLAPDQESLACGVYVEPDSWSKWLGPDDVQPWLTLPVYCEVVDCDTTSAKIIDVRGSVAADVLKMTEDACVIAAVDICWSQCSPAQLPKHSQPPASAQIPCPLQFEQPKVRLQVDPPHPGKQSQAPGAL